MAVVIGLPAERVERAVTGSEDTRRGPKFASADRRTHVVGMRPAPRTFHDALNRLFTGDAAPMKAIWSHGDDVVYMGPVGGVQVGWTQVEPYWDKQASRKLGGRVDAVDVHITASPSLAIAH